VIARSGHLKTFSEGLPMTRQALRTNIPAFLIFLFFTTIVVTSFHHHVDLWVHSGCATCKVAKALASNDTPTIIQIPLPQISKEKFKPEDATFYQVCLTVPDQARAPPTLFPQNVLTTKYFLPTLHLANEIE
jgi:hypothetical protein